ncbi:MAG: nucleotidyltransferase domain-containing protein [Bacteroidaceae bacterium]|nr:nucleotidyltransferase domain-containing protein [Bacteroidaceae bacterium]
MKYGLKDEQWIILCNTFAKNPHIEKVILYGSRAKGTYKPFSDVDITLVGKSLSTDDLTDMMNAIDDLLLPYMFDISLYHKLKSPELLDHISRRGIVIYHREQ